MARQSAGLLLYRWRADALEVFLVHPGGPFWAKRDLGAWSIPKGEHDAEEDPLAAARREFTEETGLTPEGEVIALAPIRQKGGKVVRAFALEGECDSGAIRSNTFVVEWPPRSGRERTFPEIDRAGWFTLAEAGRKLNPAQAALVEELARLLAGPEPRR
jgi:predicted NUDIX family NTP pyrophosphohydrolase